jgi:hypothetical protein
VNDVQQSLQTPNVICQTSLHRGCNAQSLVDSAKVVVHEVERDHVAVVLQLLAESVPAEHTVAMVSVPEWSGLR